MPEPNRRTENRAPGSPPPEHIERKESELWRVSLLFLTLLATALAIHSWERLRTLPQRLEALPIGVLVLAALFAGYVWRKRREIAELRAYVRGMQAREEAPPSEAQLERLVEILSRSQKGYRELVDSIDDAVFALSLEGEIRAANQRFAEVFGRGFPEIIGHRLDDFVEEPSRGSAEKALPRFLERRNWSGIVRVRMKNTGATLFFDCVLRAIVREGQVVGVSGLARDVTRLRESEARFTGLFESLHEGVYFLTPEGQLLDANPALVRMLGYDSKEELLGVNAQKLYLDPVQRKAQLGQVDEQGSVREYEIGLRRKDGTPLVCQDTSTAIRDTSGRVVRYQGTLVDITQRREMERRLHEEQEFTRRLVDCFPDLVVVLDTEGRYRYVSPRSLELLGYAPEELVGQTLGDQIDSEDRDEVLELFRGIIQGERTVGLAEYRTQRKDGRWRLFRAAAAPLLDPGGEIGGVVASARDVTEVRQLEQQVIQSEKLAAMGQMIAGVAHELNNPLTAILGISELLRERAPDEAMRRQLELTHQQARRAAEIVQNLLTFARPSASRKESLNLSDLVRRTIQLHEYSLRTHNIRVDFEAEPNLPWVVGDPSQLVQVFLNLVINAEQAVREVRDHGTLRIRLGQRDGRVWVSLQDDGPGIRPELLTMIFDPFFTTKRPGRGTGLGLSICLAIVKDHGGTIEAQAVPPGGNGSVFTVVLPTEGKKVAPTAEKSPAAAPVSLEGRTVLVVDDEESIRELVQVGLSARGVEVECVGSGEEALGRAAGRSYDLILCDMRMPGMSGQEVLEKLRGPEKSGSHRFIFMTGDLAEPATLEFLRQSGARVLQKPFRIADLVAVLREEFASLSPKAV